MKIEQQHFINKARLTKNDEFYTSYETAEFGISKHFNELKGKKVLCPCNDLYGDFKEYLVDKFDEIGLKSLTVVGYSPGSRAISQHITKETFRVDFMEGDGDFRSEEIIELIKDHDVIITNPPFSLFYPFLKMLKEFNKKFLIIGHRTSLRQKPVWKSIVNNEISFFKIPAKLQDYREPNGNMKNIATLYYTNLKQHEKTPMPKFTKMYNKQEYPNYLNYPKAINVDKIKDIPKDYYGEMGVPITIFQYDMDEFELVYPDANDHNYIFNTAAYVRENNVVSITDGEPCGGVGPLLKVTKSMENRKFYTNDKGDIIINKFMRVIIKRKL